MQIKTKISYPREVILNTYRSFYGQCVSGGGLKVEGAVDPEQHLVGRVVHRPPEGPRDPVLLGGVSRLDNVVHLEVIVTLLIRKGK